MVASVGAVGAIAVLGAAAAGASGFVHLPAAGHEYFSPNLFGENGRVEKVRPPGQSYMVMEMWGGSWN